MKPEADEVDRPCRKRPKDLWVENFASPVEVDVAREVEVEMAVEAAVDVDVASKVPRMIIRVEEKVL